MKIILDFYEFLMLQRARKGIAAGSRTKGEANVLVHLHEHGLIGYDRDVFSPIFITPGGLKVLKRAGYLGST